MFVQLHWFMAFVQRHIMLFVLLVVMTVLSSCKNVSTIQQHAERSTCTQQNAAHYSQRDIPRPFHELELDTVLTNHFSWTSLNVANAIGLLDELKVFVESSKVYKAQPTIENRIDQLVWAQSITDRINLASLEVSAAASELDCEEERITQIAEYLKGVEGETESKLTVAAIVVGASSAIISGIMLANGNGGNVEYVGIVSGIVEATLGISILANKRKVLFYHPRNALQEVWQGRETSEVFPPFIWYYLNYQNPSDTNHRSVRYQIIDRWISFKQIDNANTKKKRKLLNLYFGEGGKYKTEQLYNRANMYDQLESHVKMMKQDLMLLSLEFEKLN
jgi:hypothetical protein